MYFVCGYDATMVHLDHYGNPPPGKSVRDFLIRWIEVGRATLSGWHYSGGWGSGLGKKGMERWVKHYLSASWLWWWCEHLFMFQSLCRPARAEHTQTVVQCIAFVNSLSQHQGKERIQSLASVTARWVGPLALILQNCTLPTDGHWD